MWRTGRSSARWSWCTAALLLLAGCGGGQPPVVETPPTPTGVPVVTYSPPPDGSPAHVLFAGDSLTAGFNASTPQNAYRSLVTVSLGGQVEAEAAAVAGLSIVSAITNVPSNLNLAVIELGTNDVERTPLPAFKAAYTTLVNRIRLSSPNAALVCMGVWGADGGDYDNSIESSCKAGGGVFIRLNALFVTPGYRGPAGVPGFTGLSDDFHPNDAGHKALAGAVLAAVPRE